MFFLVEMSFPLVLATGALALSLYYYYYTKKKSMESDKKFQSVRKTLDYANQSAEVKLDGELVRVSKYSIQADGSVKFLSYLFNDCKTLFDVLPRGNRQSNNGRCLGSINPTRTAVDWISFAEVLKRAKFFGDGLLELGLVPKSTYGIYSANTPEYLITEFGCYNHSIVVVPIYETLGSNVCAFIAKQAELKVIYCDRFDRVETLLENSKDFEHLEHIVVSSVYLDVNQNSNAFDALKQRSEACGFKLHTILDVEQLGQSNPKEDHPPTPDDLAVICYTSGTTDAPKGVMLTHENIVACFSGIYKSLLDYKLDQNDTLFSYLPLGHMFERICEAGMLSSGGSIGYSSGDIRNLSSDMQMIHPTMLPCVPRVLNKIYSRIHENAGQRRLNQWLLNKALSYKKAQLANHVFDQNTIWDKIVFDKIRKLMGGKVRLMPVGSAPLNAEVLNFMRCALGCHILEGYGQTEATAACSVTQIGDFTVGHVGVPLSTIAIKLIDVPDMNYFVAENGGEVCLKGPIVFQGYFKDPKKTAETIDEKGWLHTGDIGRWNENGTLRIIDRKKDIFKLSQGEYIAPAKIEDVYSQSPLIQQNFVYGDSFKACLVGIVVPNIELVRDALQKEDKDFKIDFQNTDQFVNNVRVKNFVMQELNKLAKASGLKSFEQIKAIRLLTDGWTIEEGLLTPTLKNKRFALKKHFEKEIAELYQILE